MLRARIFTDALAWFESHQSTEPCREWVGCREAEHRRKMETRHRATQSEHRTVHLAINGTVLKGAGTQVDGGEQLHTQVWPVSEVHAGMAVHRCPMDEKQKEISALTPLVTEVVYRGRMLTTDSAHIAHACGRRVSRDPPEQEGRLS